MSKKFFSVSLILLTIIFLGCSAEKTTPSENKEQTVEADETRLQKEQKAVESGNADLCEEIANEDGKYACRFNVIVNQALAEKNPALCQEIGKEPYITNCLQNIPGEE